VGESSVLRPISYDVAGEECPLRPSAPRSNKVFAPAARDFPTPRLKMLLGRVRESLEFV